MIWKIFIILRQNLYKICKMKYIYQYLAQSFKLKYLFCNQNNCRSQSFYISIKDSRELQYCKQNSAVSPRKINKYRIIFRFMEQVKFKTLAINSSRKTYIFNKDTRTNVHTKEPIINKSQSYPNLIATFKNQEAAYSISRRRQKRKKNFFKTAKAEIANKNLSKQTLKKLRRVNTQQNQYSKSQLEGNKNLKSYISGITKICNNIQKSKAITNGTAKDKVKELALRLDINNLSFAEISEEKIEKQQFYLNNFKHLKQGNQKMVGTAVLGQQKAIGELLVIAFTNIDKLYEILQEMQAVGYFKRQNKSIINFCTTNKVWLAKIFLYEQKCHKDAFSIKTQWLVVSTSEQAKEKLSDFLMKGGKVNFHVIKSDIEELIDYLEHSVGQKKLLEISKLGDYIQSRLKGHQFQQMERQNVQNVRFSKSKTDECDFSKELIQLEKKYGSMNFVTKVSRRRFQDLCQTYDKLQNLL